MDLSRLYIFGTSYLMAFYQVMGFQNVTLIPTFILMFSYFYLLLGLYIDNFILISNNLEHLFVSKMLFTHWFFITDNNEIEYILGIQVKRN